MPLTNEDIEEFKQLLAEIRDGLKPQKPVVEAEKPKHKGGRPKGSRNVKRRGRSTQKATRGHTEATGSNNKGVDIDKSKTR